MTEMVHHIAPGDRDLWHPVWHRCLQSWIDHSPSSPRVWDDGDEIDQLVRDHYAQHWNLYRALPYHIQRIDFARLCILHRHGGIYADLDYFCYQDFGPGPAQGFMAVANCNHDYTTAAWENCLLGARRGEPFLAALMEACQAGFIQLRNQLRSTGPDWRDETTSFAVNNSTGSGMLSAAIQQLGSRHDVGHWPSHTHNPDPTRYHDGLFGKHVHSGIWGREYLSHASRSHVMIHQGRMWNITADQAESESPPDALVMAWQDFDFYRDYGRELDAVEEAAT